MTLQLVETVFLVALSLVWYVSIAQLVLNRRAAPKRPAVIAVLTAACLLGMSLKLEAVAATGRLDPIFWLYGFNFLIVFFDLQLTAHYGRQNHYLREFSQPARRRGTARAETVRAEMVRRAAGGSLSAV